MKEIGQMTVHRSLKTTGNAFEMNSGTWVYIEESNHVLHIYFTSYQPLYLIKLRGESIQVTYKGYRFKGLGLIHFCKKFCFLSTFSLPSGTLALMCSFNISNVTKYTRWAGAPGLRANSQFGRNRTGVVKQCTQSNSSDLVMR